MIGTQYVMAVIRILDDASDDEDLAQGHASQDAITVEPDSPSTFEVPQWDPVSQMYEAEIGHCLSRPE